MNIDNVYKKINDNGIKVFSYNIPETKAVTIEMNKKYGIFINHDLIKDTDEEFLIATHEYGHCMSGATHKLNSEYDLICQHEYRADRRAVLDFLPIEKLYEAIDQGCQTVYEFAKQLELPEEFVAKAFKHYMAMELI